MAHGWSFLEPPTQRHRDRVAHPHQEGYHRASRGQCRWNSVCTCVKNVSHLQQELIQETGVDPGWINNGGLFIANNKERMEEYRRLYTMGKVLGIESHLLSPEETKVDIKSTPTFIHSQSNFSGPAQGSQDQGSAGLVSHVLHHIKLYLHCLLFLIFSPDHNSCSVSTLSWMWTTFMEPSIAHW